MPTGQVAAVYSQEAAPAGLNAPAAQGRQVAGDAAPTVGEKVPAAQRAHDATPPAAPYVPAAHGVQAEMEEAPVAIDQVPAGQGKGAMELKGQ